MKSLVFKELLLVSVQRKQARKIRFHRTTTIISGDNATGKSQILKSLYSCFGAEPEVNSDLFDAAKLHIVLHFALDGRDYSILRDADAFTLFNKEQKVIANHRKVLGGLAVDLAKLFDFHLEFYTASEESDAAHPRYLFAPFYIDQDRGWISPWASFENLNASNRLDAIEYHVGIRPNDFYRAKAQLRQVQSEAKEPTADRDALSKLLDRLKADAEGVEFSPNFEAYSEDVEQLLLECRELQEKEEAFRSRIVELENERIQLHQSIEVAGRAALEHRKDFKHAVSSQPAKIECPMCGAQYQNGIREQFRIVHDEITCEDVRASLANRVAALDERLVAEQGGYESVRAELGRVNAILDARRNEVSLREVIHAEGKREVRNEISDEIAALDSKLADLDRRVADLRRIMKASNDSDRKERILTSYRSALRNIAIELEAIPIPEEMLGSVAPRIRAGSSEFPRRLLAYFVAVLRVIHKETTSTYCPVVVDTVNQQDQSGENLARMYGLLARGLPEGTQLILACVNTRNVQFPGDVIRLDEKHAVLRSEEYTEGGPVIQKMLDARFQFEMSLRQTEST